MPDFDHGRATRSLEQLRDLAAFGRERAQVLPAEQVRVLGARRHRHRIAATVAATSLAVAFFTGGALTVSEHLVGTSTAPQPVDTPPSDRQMRRNRPPGQTVGPGFGAVSKGSSSASTGDDIGKDAGDPGLPEPTRAVKSGTPPTPPTAPTHPPPSVTPPPDPPTSEPPADEPPTSEPPDDQPPVSEEPEVPPTSPSSES